MHACMPRKRKLTRKQLLRITKLTQERDLADLSGDRETSRECQRLIDSIKSLVR